MLLCGRYDFLVQELSTGRNVTSPIWTLGYSAMASYIPAVNAGRRSLPSESQIKISMHPHNRFHHLSKEIMSNPNIALSPKRLKVRAQFYFEEIHFWQGFSKSSSTAIAFSYRRSGGRSLAKDLSMCSSTLLLPPPGCWEPAERSSGVWSECRNCRLN